MTPSPRHLSTITLVIFHLLLVTLFSCGQKQSVKTEPVKQYKNITKSTNAAEVRFDAGDEPSDEDLEKIKKEIHAEYLKKENDKYRVMFLFSRVEIGLLDDYWWQTNLTYIGEVKTLDRNGILQQIAGPLQEAMLTKEEQKQMQEYQKKTKKEYDLRMSNVNITLSNIQKYEQLGGMLIPQGTVIYNTTGRNYQYKITSYADASWLGVYAPIQETREGQQDLFSYDATVFGAISLADKNIVQLGTPKGSVFFNSKEGYLEYVYVAGKEHFQFDPQGRPIRAAYFSNEKNRKIGGTFIYQKGEKKFIRNDDAVQDFPEIVISADFMLNYDIANNLSWGVDVDLDTHRLATFYYFSVYHALKRVYGYWHEDASFWSSELTRLYNTPSIFTSEALYGNAYNYGSLIHVQNKMYVGNALLYSKGTKTGRLAYFEVETPDFMKGKVRTNQWGLDKANNKPMVNSIGKRYYPGIPSFYNNPYAYDFSSSESNEENIWVKIYPIGSDQALKKIDIKDIKIGNVIMDYINLRKDIKRKIKTPPQVNSIQYISDDVEGFIYFVIGLNIEQYDYSPLIMAIDQEGKLRLLTRLMSAAGDQSAIVNQARMGSSYYDFRVVITPDMSIFEVWNSTKGVGVGKFEVRK